MIIDYLRICIKVSYQCKDYKIGDTIYIDPDCETRDRRFNTGRYIDSVNDGKLLKGTRDYLPINVIETHFRLLTDKERLIYKLEHE